MRVAQRICEITVSGPVHECGHRACNLSDGYVRAAFALSICDVVVAMYCRT